MLTRLRIRQTPGLLTLILWSITVAGSGVVVAEPTINTPGTNKPHWSWKLRGLASFMEGMAADLTGVLVGAEAGDGILEIGVPNVVPRALETEVSALLVVVSPDGNFVATGVTRISIQHATGAFGQFMTLTEGSLTRTLSLNYSLFDDTLTVRGLLSFDDGTPGLSGGWTYSPSTGAMANTFSAPGFDVEVGRMLHVPTLTAGVGPVGIIPILIFVGNVWTMLINNVLDALGFPCEAAMSCAGPKLNASCDGDAAPPCSDAISDLCSLIDDIPDVSPGFKQCMKGRCGCGGSCHDRIEINCEYGDTSCGPCVAPPSPVIASGCSLGGSQTWYCNDEFPNPCRCVRSIFHEMSHGCGALDNVAGPMSSDGIAGWFEEQFRKNPDVACPVVCAPCAP